MKYIYLFTLFAFYSHYAFGQRLPVDSSTFGKWPSIGDAVISNDGNYSLYTVFNNPLGSHTLVIQAIKDNWKMEVNGGINVVITRDSRMVIFIQHKDSLGLVTLGRYPVEYISHVSSFKVPKKGTGEWIAYQLNTPTKELVVRNLITNKEKYYLGVNNYLFSDDGKVLLLQSNSNGDSTATHLMKWISLDDDNNNNNIWEGTKSTNLVFDGNSTQLAFIAEGTKNNSVTKSLCYYKVGTKKAVLLADDYTIGIDYGLEIGGISGFSKDGNRIFFNLKEMDSLKPKPNAVNVDVWSYTDTKLQSQQLNELAPRTYAAVFRIDDHRIIRLEHQNESSNIKFLNYYDGVNDDFVIIYNREGDADISEMNWNSALRTTLYLVSTHDGERKYIKETKLGFAGSAVLSPEGKYVIYYDAKQKNYFSYASSSGVTRNITKNVHVAWTYKIEEYWASNTNIPISGWLKGDNAVLICDQNDIWLIDPAGAKLPVNLTNGYGYKHNIVFRLAMKEYSARAINGNEKLILSAFDLSNKNNGFYYKNLNSKGDPELLTMGPYVYNIDIDISSFYSEFSPLKARDSEIYLIQRMSALESPNYFCTTDFKIFRPLSHLHPEKDYNWLRTELLTYKTVKGSISQGILYKPENFDPQKIYPVILHYYARHSDQLNRYLIPAVTQDHINIPMFVSNGYLVFTPDIHYQIGYPGKSILNSVLGAVKYLIKFPWVDAKHIGIQGHSYGGYETNYIITHTDIFAAAVSGAGISDLISIYGSLWKKGNSMQEYYELRRGGIGATLWQRPDLYIKNSPIFRADMITTPLLMMNNKNDDAVPFAQGVEFFTALRRLGKRVWMLQYDGEGHSIIKAETAKDYTIRITQFFDHYLKGTPAPKWMTEGVPAKLKGIKAGLELDESGKKP